MAADDDVWEVVTVMVTALRHALDLLHQIEDRQTELMAELRRNRSERG